MTSENKMPQKEALTEEMMEDLVRIASQVSGRLLMEPEFKMPDGTVLTIDHQGRFVGGIRIQDHE